MKHRITLLPRSDEKKEDETKAAPERDKSGTQTIGSETIEEPSAEDMIALNITSIIGKDKAKPKATIIPKEKKD
jgi:hypothetical protein